MASERDIKAAVSAKTGAPEDLVQLNTMEGEGEDLQYIWVIPGQDAGMFFVEEDELGGETIVILTGSE